MIAENVQVYQGWSDTVLDIVNARNHDKPLIFIKAAFREKLVSHHQTVDVNY